MNITPKASPQDVAGALGLLAFLADKDACAGRLKELEDAADRAEKSYVTATAAADAANVIIANAAKATTEAAETTNHAAMAQDAVESVKTDLDTRTAALALAEKAHADAVAELASQQVDYDTALADLVAQKKELKVAQATLKDDQDAIAANKDLLEKLSAFKG